jgi:hypothetical protein
MSREWNYHPELPLADPSLFKWPPDPRFLGRWVVRNWLTISERVIMVLLATLCWWLFYPALESVKTFAFGWVPSGMARQSMPDDRDRGRAPLFFLYTEGTKQKAEVRSSRPWHAAINSGISQTKYMTMCFGLWAAVYCNLRCTKSSLCG